MALIKCSECGNEISDKAQRCPQCGAPVIHKWRCSTCGNMISEEPCQYCCDSQNTVNNMDTEKSETNTVATLTFVEKTKKILTFLLIAAIAIIIIIIVFALKSNGNKESDSIDMGAIGNKIIVDGTVAYVADENKILVPYDFSGNFSECNSATYEKELMGCDNPRLPTNETNDLPEEVAREIISFYGDIGGFWTSSGADHSNIEIVGYESNPCHYAGIMKNYFSLREDGVSDIVWGYCLDATDDTTTMGLLVLYDVVIGEFEFTDVEDTADPNYSTQPVFESIQSHSEESSLLPTTGFGGYEWYILDQKNDMQFLLSKDAVACLGEGNEISEGEWADNYVREYLNHDFYNSFTDLEKERILLTHNNNELITMQGVLESAPTDDKIFLLTNDELSKYLTYNDELLCKYNGKSTFWFTRTALQFNDAIVLSGINGKGQVYGKDNYERGQYEYGNCVRPAMWVNIS